MRYAIAAALVATSALAAPAMAQDVNPAFTGPRVGILGGYDGIKPGSTERLPGDETDRTVNGFVYGGEIGYDFAIGGLVAGVEAELTDSTGKVETNRQNPNTFGFGEVNTGRDIYVGARLGGLVTPSTLLYAKGGYTNARLNVLGSDGTNSRRENFELDGWRLGAGAEQALSYNTYAKLEYRYSNYSSANFQFADGATTRNFGIDTDRHQVMAGVGMRF
jgi:outer membrane immunogenic protein